MGAVLFAMTCRERPWSVAPIKDCLSFYGEKLDVSEEVLKRLIESGDREKWDRLRQPIFTLEDHITALPLRFVVALRT